MSSNREADDMTDPGKRAGSTVPKTTLGWWALGVSAVGLSSWVVLPMLTMLFRETYPVTDTWIMPLIGTVLVGLAAVLNVLTLWKQRDRSVLNVVATILTLPIAVAAVLVLVGGVFGGA
ncbi:MAG: hypothetical protein ACYC1U_01255 [Candidatus Aquicultorales bacterium]